MTHSDDDRVRAACEGMGVSFAPWEIAPWQADAAACPWPAATAGAASWPKARAARQRILARLAATDD